MPKEVIEKPLLAVGAAVQLPSVSDDEFEASIQEQITEAADVDR